MSAFRSVLITLFVSYISIPAAYAAVDMNSDAYKSGSIVGKIFVVVLAMLIIRKLFARK